MNLMSPVIPLAVAAALAASAPVAAQWTHGPPPVVDEAATMLDRLGAAAELDLSFVDEHGTPVVLRDFADGSLPIVLNLGYFNCPGMCGFVLNQFLQHLEGSELTPGRDFRLLTLSVHHAEGPQLALEKKQTYVDNLGAPAWTADWPFLTGDEASIRALTDSVGWRFRFDEFARDVDHPPTLVLLSPTGQVARYLDARQLTPSTVRRGIIEAGDGQVGTFIERLLVSCYTFDPETGRYAVTAMTVMRIGGGLTVVAIAAMIIVLWRREKQRLVLASA